MYRSRERVEVIDEFVKQHYPTHGPDYCAEELNETRAYIQNRAWYLKVKQISRRKKEKKKTQREINKELRLELIKVVAENRQLRKMLEEAQ